MSRFLLLLAVPLLISCVAADAIVATGHLASAVMNFANPRKEDDKKSVSEQPLLRRLSFRIHASDKLNAGTGAAPASLIVRLYAMKNPANFSQAPYHTLMEPGNPAALPGTDLTTLREILLLPGQRLDLVESIPVDASHIGVVALFRQPAVHGWKAVFLSTDAESKGIVLGAHACQLSIGTGAIPLDGVQRAWEGASRSCN